MRDTPEQTPTRGRTRLPYWAALLIGVLGCAVVANFLTIASEYGAFTAWEDLPRPPGGAASVVDALPESVWVETQPGGIFTYDVSCGEMPTCWQLLYAAGEGQTELERGIPLERGPHCPRGFSPLFPLDPSGNMKECVLAGLSSPDATSDTYYAVMEDGSIEMWRLSSSATDILVTFLFSTVVMPVLAGVVISAFYAGMRVGRTQAAAPRGAAFD